MSVAEGDAHLSRIERYYDFIYHWSQITSRFRAFAAPGSYAIHRGLVDPLTGEFSSSTVHRLIADRIPAAPDLMGLDAGCGYAGTMIELHRLLGGSWHGITISRRQVRVAQRNIDRLGLRHAVRVSLRSFDHRLDPATYHVVVAIESLIHSTDPAHTVRSLAGSLNADGRLIIVDDMPVVDVAARLQDDLRAFKRNWRCPVMPSLEEWSRHLRSAGCEVVNVHDLTHLMRPRPESETQAALDEVARKRAWRDTIGLELVSDAQEGGLRLERLASEGAVKYTMIEARKSRSDQSPAT
jgi:2-polyprenyl-3-methyl-5-hydroxy-6-metoxy-1,4-benzoquinol methylase